MRWLEPCALAVVGAHEMQSPLGLRRFVFAHLALFDILLDHRTLRRARLALGAQQVAGREVDKAERLDNLGALRALASARTTQDEDNHRPGRLGLPVGDDEVLRHGLRRERAPLLDRALDRALTELQDVVRMHVRVHILTLRTAPRRASSTWQVVEAGAAARNRGKRAPATWPADTQEKRNGYKTATCPSRTPLTRGHLACTAAPATNKTFRVASALCSLGD